MYDHIWENQLVGEKFYSLLHFMENKYTAVQL